MALIPHHWTPQTVFSTRRPNPMGDPAQLLPFPSFPPEVTLTD